MIKSDIKRAYNQINSYSFNTTENQLDSIYSQVKDITRFAAYHVIKGFILTSKTTIFYECNNPHYLKVTKIQ